MMDRELAEAVLERWHAGDPVSEMGLYKAAHALGIDPQAALAEARFHTYVDSYLLEKRAMSGAERIVFSAAAGFDSSSMTKTASVHGLSPDELIIEALRERNFVPDLSKIAMIAPPMGDPAMGGGQPPADPSMGDPALPQAAGAAMMQPPQPGAQLQQQPAARIRPTPTAPEQVAPSEMGNIEELLAMSQQANPAMADAGGGVPPAGAPDAQPQPMDPVSRIMQVGPNLDQETAGRYAEQLQRFEEGFGMQISDPKQMVKFVKELQKVDSKKVDQGIKAMGQQLEQEQAQELGIDGGVPTIDGGGGPQVMAPKPGGEQPPGGAGGPPQEGKPPQGPPGGGGGGAGGPEEPAQQLAEQMAAGGKPPSDKMPPRPPQKQQGPQQAAPQQAAVEKVAHAARVLARATAATR
jgi:DNA polymerase-3 subunit gamma/tau